MLAHEKRFVDAISEPARTVCELHGLDPAECVAHAAVASNGGRYVLFWNWWGLEGLGDDGYTLAVVPVWTGKAEGGGWSADVRKLARFTSPTAAVEAWCRAQQ